MLYGGIIQSKQVDKVAPFHDRLKTLKLKILASDCVIKTGCHVNALAHLSWRAVYVTTFNMCSILRNVVIH